MPTWRDESAAIGHDTTLTTTVNVRAQSGHPLTALVNVHTLLVGGSRERGFA
jgi:hypothetical protein